MRNHGVGVSAVNAAGPVGGRSGAGPGRAGRGDRAGPAAAGAVCGGRGIAGAAVNGARKDRANSADIWRLSAAPACATTVLTDAGATVAATEPGTLTISNLSSERTVGLLTGARCSSTEVAAHSSTLEQAYLELTSEAVEFHTAGAGVMNRRDVMAAGRLPRPGSGRPPRLRAPGKRGNGRSSGRSGAGSWGWSLPACW